MHIVKVCENGVQALDIVENLTAQGFNHDGIYVFAHGTERSKDLTDATDTAEVGIGEQGLFHTISNVFQREVMSFVQNLKPSGYRNKKLKNMKKCLIAGK
ncbi:general stress protein [Bacillus sp. N9]